METKTSPRVSRKDYRRVEYRCKLCPTNHTFGDPEKVLEVASRAPLVREKRFVLWMQNIAAHLAVHHPVYAAHMAARPSLAINEFLLASYS